MSSLLVAFALFVLAHAIPARPPVRAVLVARLGLRGYLLAYSALSLVLLGWLVHAAVAAPYVPLWQPRPWQYWPALLGMPVAVFLVAGGLICPNPFSLGRGAAGYDRARPGIVALTRHPVLWGLALWAWLHVVPNGDLTSVLLFGGLGMFSLVAMRATDRRRRRLLGAEWEWLLPSTRSARWPVHALAASLLVSLLGYAALLRLHPIAIGPDPLAVLHP